MIAKKKVNFLREKYGKHASWAIWAEAGIKPKDNMGDLTVFDIEINKNLLSELNPDIILVALNFSESVNLKPFENFHAGGKFQDYKTRFALKNSPLWGGYMTDILKDFPEKYSNNVYSYLRKHPKIEDENIHKFRQEIQDVGSENPLLVAFGEIVHKILIRNMQDFKIIKIPHYAHQISKEKYREKVKSVISQNGIS